MHQVIGNNSIKKLGLIDTTVLLCVVGVTKEMDLHCSCRRWGELECGAEAACVLGEGVANEAEDSRAGRSHRLC